MTPVSRYAASSRWLHWLTALLLVAVIPLGIWIGFFEPADQGFSCGCTTCMRAWVCWCSCSCCFAS